jgi:hypothetical protein
MADIPDEVAALLDEVRLNALRKINEILAHPSDQKPIRHATAILSAARTALDFTQAKPAAVVENKMSGALETHVHIHDHATGK